MLVIIASGYNIFHYNFWFYEFHKVLQKLLVNNFVLYNF